MALMPPVLVQQAMMASSSNITRRCAIYEADGLTLWSAGGEGSRLIDGSVSIDYGRDERRTLECTLENTDGALRHNPDGFWYDKVLKVYYGVEYLDTVLTPTSKVRTNLCQNPSINYTTYNWGWSNGVAARTTTWNRIPGSCSMIFVPDNATGLVFTSINSVVGKTYTVSAWFYSMNARNIGMNTDSYFKDFGVPAAVWTRASFTFVATSTSQLVYCNPGGNAEAFYFEDMLIEEGSTVGWYFDGNTTDTSLINNAWISSPDMSESTCTVSGFAKSKVPTTWETQIGEFVIDRLDGQNFPPSIKITARDYTKKCLISKFTTATAFTTGVTIESVIKAIAQNAGITKFLLPATGKVTGKDFFFERGTERWAAMKEIAQAYGFDIYFDGQGFLTLKAFSDPVSAPLSHVLLTGPEGNLVSFTKSVNDSRLYNHIVVTGESSDTTVVPVSAEATNTEPSSPCRIARIGDRVYQYTSSFITTVLQAQEIADNFLRVHALEEYDVNFSAIMAPWLEVGEIVEFYDPDAGPTDPIRFLLSSLGVPLGLSPMSGNAKRVGIV